MAKITQTDTTAMTQHEKWQMTSDAANAERNVNADQLSDSQRKALMDAFIAIRNVYYSFHEMFMADVSDMLAIDKAEYKLRSEFPQLTEEAVSDMTCTCED